MTKPKTFDVEVLFDDQDEAQAMIDAVTALGHKVECNSIVFMPSGAPYAQPGDVEMLSFSVEIARARGNRRGTVGGWGAVEEGEEA
jgi:hypothetical protein